MMEETVLGEELSPPKKELRMKTKIRLIRFVFVIVALGFGNIIPSRADDNLPPTDAAADIITLTRVNDLAPGATSSDPSDMVVYGGNLYYAADAK